MAEYDMNWQSLIAEKDTLKLNLLKLLKVFLAEALKDY